MSVMVFTAGEAVDVGDLVAVGEDGRVYKSSEGRRCAYNACDEGDLVQVGVPRVEAEPTPSMVLRGGAVVSMIGRKPGGI